MKVTYDPEADAVFIEIATGDYDESEEVAPNVMLDFDKQGRVLAVEVLTASKVLAPGDWTKAALPGGEQVEAAE